MELCQNKNRRDFLETTKLHLFGVKPSIKENTKVNFPNTRVHFYFSKKYFDSNNHIIKEHNNYI